MQFIYFIKYKSKSNTHAGSHTLIRRECEHFASMPTAHMN